MLELPEPTALLELPDQLEVMELPALPALPENLDQMALPENLDQMALPENLDQMAPRVEPPVVRLLAVQSIRDLEIVVKIVMGSLAKLEEAILQGVALARVNAPSLTT